MKGVLVIGSGGREHAIGWRIKTQNNIPIYFAPGNGGTDINININSNDLEGLVRFAKERDLFTIVGPEEPLAKGIVNIFEKNNLQILGPNKEAAIIEYSKAFAKEFMKRHNINTPRFKIFDSPEDAKDYVKDKDNIVIKADGLAAGKGVIVCNNSNEAINAIDNIMIKREFGNAGNKIVIEERLYGYEASFIALSDGKNIITLASSQDHKRLYDDDQGPNTGGMGAYSPMPLIDEMKDKITNDIIKKAINGLRSENREFKGFLYAGLMIVNNEPYVLEFNVRLGDPEAQVILPRMKSNLLEYAMYASNSKLDELEPIIWSEHSAVCVILASNGYPFKYERGKVIHGLEEASKHAIIFHAGTIKQDNNILTNGGRVLGVTSLGKNLKDAINNTYNALRFIRFDNMYYRSDIGKRALLMA